jgi:hypothetical protein
MNQQLIELLKWLNEQIEESELSTDDDRDIYFYNKGQVEAYQSVKEYIEGMS